MNDLISVIVPVYNAEKYLVRCLDSLARQTFPNIEFILVDDGSKDKSGEICRQYAERDSRFRYYYKENGGPSSARNVGLEHINGQFVGYCDSDDWVEPGMYEALYRLITDAEADVAIHYFIEDNGEASDTPPSDYQCFTGEQAVKELLCANIKGYTCVKMFRYQTVSDLRFDTDTKFCEDEVYCLKASLASQKVVYQNARFYHYCYNGSSICHKTDRNIIPVLSGFDKIFEIVRHEVPTLSLYAEFRVMDGYCRVAKMADGSHVLDKNNWKMIVSRVRQSLRHRKVFQMLPFTTKIETVLLLLSWRNVYIITKKIYKLFHDKDL